MKKAQFKIQEMAFILLAIVLFFVIVGLFFVAIYSRNLKNIATNAEEGQAILIAQVLAEYPEFSCGSLCLDADRLIVMNKRRKYTNFWPVETIEVRKITKEEEKECTLENYPDCNYFKVHNSETENIRKVGSFTSLCRKDITSGQTYDKCELAKILIGYEVR